MIQLNYIIKKENEMAKKEVNTDLWVHEMLKEAEIRDKFSAQGSDIREINEALKSASKKGLEMLDSQNMLE